MEVNLVVEGMKFMLLGMTTVLLFLILMIFMMSLMSKIILKYFPEPQIVPNASAANKPGSNATQKKIAAITAAILHHKQVNS